MNPIALDNRRQAYRYQPALVMEPLMTLIVGGVRSRVQSVIDINSRGARIIFTVADAPRVTPGQEVTAAVQAPGLDGCANIEARVVFSANQGNRSVIALVFTQLPDVADRADANFFTLFNRRQHERSGGDPEANAVLLSSSDATADSSACQIRIVNRTSRSVAFVIDQTLDHLVRGRTAVDLALNDADAETPRQLNVRILHRVSRADSVYYGCTIAD